jgi:precorrin-2 dehydrogenase/sirohydrochlorin ferrochelatase/precorrin-6A/cobalt-precorrin-6A reductase
VCSSDLGVTLSVATQYGRDAALAGLATADSPESDNIRPVNKAGVTILAGRLSETEMMELAGKNAYEYVIDATHPYAVNVSQNSRSACRAAGRQYIRLKRPESPEIPGAAYVPDAGAAAGLLKGCDGNVFLAIGSKELEPFTRVDNYAGRIYVRILPAPESLNKALDLGFRGSNIICMQGPFDMETNKMMLKTVGAKYLVTKESGGAGGFDAKVAAAFSVGCGVIVIKRPATDESLACYSYNEVLTLMGVGESGNEDKKFDNADAVDVARRPNPETQRLFPLFVSLRDKKALVVGGGRVAERRIKTLLSFGADIIVISPINTEYINQAASDGKICLRERAYETGDIAALAPFLVLAATGERQVNHNVMNEAADLGAWVSVADCRKECTFYFPAIAESGNFVAGLISSQGDHSGVKRMAGYIRQLIQ